MTAPASPEHSPPPLTGLQFIDAAAIRRFATIPDVVGALEDALRGDLDPDDDPPRGTCHLAAGHMLLMPASGEAYAGAKLVTVAPANPARGLPRIQGLYVLFDGATLAPVAVFDGVELTGLRTAAVSAVAIRHLAVTPGSLMVIFGTGPQARAHFEVLRRLQAFAEVLVVGRDRAKTQAFVQDCVAAGAAARVGSAADVADAGLVVCCTTANEPLFAADLVRRDAVVVAVGSHEPGAREVPDELVAASMVVVESGAAARREAGEIVHAMRTGSLDRVTFTDLATLVRGDVEVEMDRPRLFKSVGMGWEDLVVAATVYCGAVGAAGP